MEPNTKPNRKLGVLIILLVVLFSGAVFYFIGLPMIRLVGEKDAFRQWVASHGLWADAAFIGMMIFQVVFALIPGEPFEIGAGYAFGFWRGTLLCMIAAMLGSAIIFALTRKFGRKFALLFFSAEKLDSLAFLNGSPKANALFFLLMILPASPKDLLSYAAGLTKMKFGTWMLIVLVTRWPSLVTSIAGGNLLGKQNYWFAVAVFAGTLLLSLAGYLLYRYVCKQHDKKGKK